MENKYTAPTAEVVVLKGGDIITSSRWDLPSIDFGSSDQSTEDESDW